MRFSLGLCVAVLAVLLLPQQAHAQFFRQSAQQQAFAAAVAQEQMQVPLAQAPSADGAVITDITVEGTQRIETDTVRSYLSLSKGDAATEAKLNESLKALFATGFFNNVDLSMQGSTLVVKVEENPVINRVVFEGNNAVDTDDLMKEIQLRPRQVYTKTRVKSDTKRVLDVYRRSGRFAALVEPKIINLEQNRVDLVFEVTEGERTGVRRVNFIGNSVFDADDLRDAINTRETAWWRVFSSSDFYDPDRLNYDRELLRRFYLNNGYPDFRVLSAKAELAPDRKDFFITFTVEEGDPYIFGKVDVTTSLRNVDVNALRDKITAIPGESYNSEKVEKSVALLTSTIGDLQYGFAQVQPKVQQNKEKHTVDINFVINEGPRVFVQRIEIKGNTRTLDRVIRRQMKLSEGDPYLVSNVKKSEQSIRDLGFFEDVKVSQSEGTQPDQSIINVDVKEKSTGEISIGAGFSSTDGALGDFSISERNLLGKGQNLRFGIQASARTQQYDISFTEPYFLERDLAAGFDLFRVTRDNQDTSSFDEARNGGSLRMGYALAEETRQRWTYTLSQTEITNVPTTASRYVREQEGKTLTSMVGHELMYDKRDSKLNPTEGYYIRVNNDVAGLGGDVQYLRNKLAGAYFIPVSEKWTLTLGAEAGYIFGIKQDVRINDRFYLGGDTLRGFTFAGVGPRDLTAGADDALGGNRMVRARAELSFPTGLPEEFGLRGRVFTDAGILDDVDVSPRPGDNLKLNSALRASAGVGITWASPFGPIGIDIAQPIKKESYDKTEFFRFSFGTRF
jgi:outer membrane protein insertion porin family